MTESLTDENIVLIFAFRRLASVSEMADFFGVPKTWISAVLLNGELEGSSRGIRDWLHLRGNLELPRALELNSTLPLERRA